MSIKIQINSLEALERLIGGNSDIEIEIRNNIVQEFTKKHLKGIANETLISETEKMINEEIKKSFLTKEYGFNNKFEINKDTINEIVNDIKRNFVSDLKKEMLSELKSKINIDEIKESIDETLNHSTNKIVNELQSNVLESKLNRMVDERLKKMLNITN